MSDMTLETPLNAQKPANKQPVKRVENRGRQPVTTGDKAAPAIKKPKPEENAYEKLLGRFLGGKLYGIVKKELSTKKVLKDADDAVKSLIKVMESEAGKAADKSDMSADNKKGAKAFSGALGGYLHDKAAAWLKTPGGQHFATEISKYTKMHPVTILSLALAAAAVAVATNAKVPKLKTKKTLGHGFSMAAEADLGRLQEIALESAKLQLTYQKGLLKVDTSVEGTKKDGVTKKHAEIRYGTKRNWVQTMADIDAKGVLTAGLGAGYGITDNTDITAGITRKKNKIDNANAKVEYKGKKFDLASALSYKPENDQLRLDMSVKQDKKLDISAFYVQAQKKGKTTRTYGGAAKFSVNDLKMALNGQFQTDTRVGSGSIKMNKGHLEGGAGATYDGKLGEVTKYYMYFGFKDPKTFEEYLAKYKHDKYPDYSMDEFDLKLQHAVHGLVGTVDANVQLKNGNMHSGAVSGRLAYHVDKDLSVFGGVAQGFGPEKQHGTMPFVGVEVKKVPVWVGYDTNSKGVMLGFSFRF